jgi:Flp pilus assembly protein CpaB
MRSIIYACAALLALGAASYYHQTVSSMTETVPKLRLATQDGGMVGQGTRIDEDFLQERVVTQTIPAALAEDFRWVLDDTPANRRNLLGQAFTRDVPAGSFLDRTLFFDDPEGAFARRIREGYRAFSIPVEDERAVSNFIEPGSRVDVVGVFEASPGVLETRLLLENVEVMAVGTFASRGEYTSAEAPGYDSVTLQARSAQVAEFISVSAGALGDLVLMLRNPCEMAEDCVGQSQEAVR